MCDPDPPPNGVTVRQQANIHAVQGAGTVTFGRLCESFAPAPGTGASLGDLGKFRRRTGDDDDATATSARAAALELLSDAGLALLAKGEAVGRQLD